MRVARGINCLPMIDAKVGPANPLDGVGLMELTRDVE